MVQNASENFLPIAALPMLSYAIAGALHAAKDQLENLHKAKTKPHVLDDQLVDQIIQSYTKQNESIADEKASCIYWKKSKLSAQQKKTVDELSDNLSELERVNQQILFLAEHFKEHTIDKIMGMEDIDVALSYLAGKLYPPTGDENNQHITPNKNKSFKLPPDVICQKEAIKNNGTSYTFRHKEWGEVGRIDVIPQGNQSKINAFVVANDPGDPLAEMRTALFRTIALDFNTELEKAHGKGTSIKPPVDDLNRNQKIIESKLMVCETCDAPVALLIFAPGAYTAGELEDYARMMYANTRKTNLPTWIIGAEDEVNPEKEGIALILKTWPDRQPAKKISSLIFEPMLDKLQSKHGK